MITSETYNEDCMAVMARYPDKYFDLAVVDVPYGIGESMKKRENTVSDIYKNPYKKKHNPKEWDKQAPDKDYFHELMRVSKNQIVWGANHFISRIPYDSSCWIVWDKENGQNDFADCELAWTSFNSAVRKFHFRWNGMLQGDMKNKELRIHPTQKPVKLYEWIFKNYAKPTDKILDTHLGSGSSRIAAYKAKLDFVGCELDKEYFEAQEKRFKDFKSQLTLF